MKKIEDIENMQEEQLEEAALSEGTKVPSGLEDRILASIAAAAVTEEKPRRAAWMPYAALAAAAGLAALALVPRQGKTALRDTFDDPYLAYAQVEETFRRISDKMAVGVNLAEKAGETAEKPIEIINKLNEK